VIINNTLTNTSPNYATATNPGEVSVAYTNSAGTPYNAFVKAPASRTVITNGFDLSTVVVKSPAVNNASAGMTVYFTNYVTNWGNFSENVRVRIAKTGASVPWTNSYALFLNGAGVASNAESANNVLAGLPKGTGMTVVVRVTAGSLLADGSSNRFNLVIDDQEPNYGDAWPGALALSPATADIANRRDYQTNAFLVRIAGPILDISKSVNITSGVRPFQSLTYTITVTNRGSATAYKIDVRDVLPVNVTNIIGTVRVWTNSSITSNMLNEGSGDGDLLSLTNKILKVKVPQVAKSKTSRIRFEVRVK
jgi:uncharacterized repeat protein (TIGR01451 family)